MHLYEIIICRTIIPKQRMHVMHDVMILSGRFLRPLGFLIEKRQHVGVSLPASVNYAALLIYGCRKYAWTLTNLAW